MVAFNGEKLEAKILTKIYERMIKSFMGIIIMSNSGTLRSAGTTSSRT